MCRSASLFFAFLTAGLVLCEALPQVNHEPNKPQNEGILTHTAGVKGRHEHTASCFGPHPTSTAAPTPTNATVG